jgi:hypothetical protein
MRVIVCGGRDYDDWTHVCATLNGLDITALAEGGASGADDLAAQWCSLMPDVVHHRYNADWSRDGRAAGPIRNALMLSDFKPELVVAFPGGRGTADMVKRAVAAGVKVVVA